MMRKKILLSLSAGLVCLMPIVAMAITDNVYTEDKPNIGIDAKSSKFTIKLKSNPTTGYSWFLRDYNMNLLSPVSHRFEANADKKLVGAPGYEYWTFKVKPAGFQVPQQTSLRFVYARPWQGAESATQVNFRVSTMA